MENYKHSFGLSFVRCLPRFPFLSRYQNTRKTNERAKNQLNEHRNRTAKNRVKNNKKSSPKSWHPHSHTPTVASNVNQYKYRYFKNQFVNIKCKFSYVQQARGARPRRGPELKHTEEKETFSSSATRCKARKIQSQNDE